MDHSTNLPCASSLMCLKIVISPRQRSSLTPHEQFSSIIPLFTVPNIQALSSKAGSTDKLPFAQEIKIIVITSLNCKSLDGRGHVFLIFLAKTLKMLCQEHTRYLITVCWMNEKKKNSFWKQSPSGFQTRNCGPWFQSGYTHIVTFDLHNNSRK